MERAEPLTVEQLNWRPAGAEGGRTLWPGISGTISRWHEITAHRCASFTTRLAGALAEDREVWGSGLRTRWGLDGVNLGNEDSGWKQPRKEAARMHFGSKEELFDYANQSARRSTKVLGLVRTEDLDSKTRREWRAAGRPPEALPTRSLRSSRLE